MQRAKTSRPEAVAAEPEVVAGAVGVVARALHLRGRQADERQLVGEHGQRTMVASQKHPNHSPSAACARGDRVDDADGGDGDGGGVDALA